MFPLTKKGDRATTSTAKEIFGAALEPVDKIAAEKVCYLKCPIRSLFNDERQIFIDISPFFHCQVGAVLEPVDEIVAEKVHCLKI